MKFKYLIIAFSCVVVILIAAVLPLTQAEPEIMADFQHIITPLLAFIVLILVFMGIFFLLNYRLLSLLEREDWPALSYYLEQKVFDKGRYSVRNVRLLASSYLVCSDFNAVLKLEVKAALIKPSVIEKNILLFGSARVLSGKYGEAAAFFKANMDKGKPYERQWVRWFYGFSQLLSGFMSIAEPEFTALAVSSNDALITGLSAYFLKRSIVKNSLKPEECRTIAEKGRARVKKMLHGIEKWNIEARKAAAEIHIAIIKRYIDETGKWLYERQPAARIEKVLADTQSAFEVLTITDGEKL